MKKYTYYDIDDLQSEGLEDSKYQEFRRFIFKNYECSNDCLISLYLNDMLDEENEPNLSENVRYVLKFLKEKTKKREIELKISW